MAEDTLEGTHINDIEPKLEYLAQPDGSVALAHVIQVKNKEEGAWFEAFVDAHDGTLLAINDFVAHASVSLPQSTPLPWGLNREQVQCYTNRRIQRRGWLRGPRQP